MGHAANAMNRPPANHMCDTAQPELSGATATTWQVLIIPLLWPAAAALSLSIAVGGPRVTSLGLGLVACGTMLAYGLDRWVDECNYKTKSLSTTVHCCLLLVGIVTFALACTAWWRLLACTGLGIMTAVYVPLKRYVPKNVMAAVAWAIATGVLPLASMPEWSWSLVVSMSSVAFVMMANTVLCDIPDLKMDRHFGVRGITPWLGPRAGAIAASLYGVAAASIAASIGQWSLAVTAFTLALVGLMLLRNSNARNIRFLVDAVVTAIPGPLAMLIG